MQNAQKEGKMKAPVCDICRNLHVICAVCERKLSQNIITETDFRASRILTELEKFEDLTLHRAFDIGSRIVLVVDRKETLGKFLPFLERKFGKKVVIVNGEGRPKEILKEVLEQEPRTTEAFLPGGGKAKRMVISRGELKRKGIDEQALKYMLSDTIKEMEVSIA